MRISLRAGQTCASPIRICWNWITRLTHGMSMEPRSSGSAYPSLQKKRRFTPIGAQTSQNMHQARTTVQSGMRAGSSVYGTLANRQPHWIHQETNCTEHSITRPQSPKANLEERAGYQTVPKIPRTQAEWESPTTTHWEWGTLSPHRPG